VSGGPVWLVQLARCDSIPRTDDACHGSPNKPRDLWPTQRCSSGITDQPNIKFLSKFIHKKTAALQKKVGTS